MWIVDVGETEEGVGRSGAGSANSSARRGQQTARYATVRSLIPIDTTRHDTTRTFSLQKIVPCLG